MDGVERLTQMSEVERMREIIDVISKSMRKQNDKDRMEILAMLANTTATETNLMSVNFARSANTETTGTKTKKNAKALMKGVKQQRNHLKCFDLTVVNFLFIIYFLCFCLTWYRFIACSISI